MWKELWELHRSKICAVAGGALFLSAGAAATFLPSQQEQSPPQKAQEAEKSILIQDSPSETIVRLTVPARQSEPAPKPPQELRVYITGQVNKPGLYSMPPGSRIGDLVKKAGDLTIAADDEAVNLAERLKDGQHIHIPQMGANRPKEPTARAAPSAPQTRLPQASPTSKRGPIDINRAPVEELVHLRGVGPALARRIVEYRQQHGPFRSVEELIQVRGIGAAKVKGMRGQATVSP